MSPLSHHRRTRRVLAAAAVPCLTVGLIVTGATSASAAPGDASAVGFLADLTAEVVGGDTYTVTDHIGEVTAPPDETASLAGADAEIIADLGPIGVVTVAQASAIETTATSDATGSAATASVVDAQINSAAGPLVIDAVASSVSCPADGPATADVTPPATVTLDGNVVTLDASGTTVISLTTTDPPGTVTFTLTVDQRTITTRTAAATAFVFGLQQDLFGIVQASGTLTLAQSSCEAPAPTASSLNPDSGPTAGGTVVTVDGSRFSPGQTTVTIGGITIPASAVDVAADGTSLTFTTPAHAAGPVNVVATTPTGSTAPLSYRYVAPAPTASGLHPDSGPTAGGTVVTVDGTGFTPGQTTVTIGGITIPASAVDVAADGTSLTFTTPAHAAGTVDVIVTTPHGASGALSFSYVGEIPMLPRTGSNLLPMAASGVAAVLAGTALLLLGRRRPAQG